MTATATVVTWHSCGRSRTFFFGEKVLVESIYTIQHKENIV